MNKKIIIGLIVAVTLLLAIYIVYDDNHSSNGGGGNSSSGNPEKILEKFCDGLKDYDVNKFISTLHEDMIRKIDKTLRENDSDFKNATEYLEDQFYKFENDFKYKFKSYNIDKNYRKYNEQELENFNKSYQEYYEVKYSIKEVREYTVEFKGSKDGEIKLEEMKILLLNINSNWYVFPGGIF